MSNRLDFPHLLPNQQSGSKPRCHILTSGTKNDVAQRLTGLIKPFGEVLATDSWMPEGFDERKEAQLHTAVRLIPSAEMRASLTDWWLAAPTPRTKTPNWDIASTCTIAGKPGLLLIEAKAHDAELRNEEKGKPLGKDDDKGVSIDSRRNHVRIGACIQEASLALSDQTDMAWALSRDWNYQMANRFSWLLARSLSLESRSFWSTWVSSAARKCGEVRLKGRSRTLMIGVRWF
jgi:hypothetical protein